MKKPRVLGSTRILQTDFFALREDLLEYASGTVQPMRTLLLTDATVLLAKDTEGRYILNREYRHSTGEVLLGCPGGCLEMGEDPIEGGKREFFEETGYWANDVTLLGCCYPLPGLSNQKIYHLYAKGAVKKGPQSLDPQEYIETELLEEEELRALISRGERVDGILLTALWYKDHFHL